MDFDGGVTGIDGGPMDFDGGATVKMMEPGILMEGVTDFSGGVMHFDGGVTNLLVGPCILMQITQHECGTRFVNFVYISAITRL